MKLPKPNKYGRVRRGSLLKLIEAGLVEAKCTGRYTDDYAWDNATNFGRTEWLPARIAEGREDFKEGHMNFDREDFSSRYSTGGAYVQENGEYRFNIHSNLSYQLRVKGGKNE